MRTRLLTEADFKATFTTQMLNVTESAENVLNIWPYVGSIPTGELNGHQVYDEFVESVYRSDDGRFDHVCVMTRTPNVCVVIVVDIAEDRIYGHRLLDLNCEYGIGEPQYEEIGDNQPFRVSVQKRE